MPLSQRLFARTVRRCRWAAGSALSCACCAGSLAASPADLFGTGADSVARAGTGVASTDGSAAAHLNPALLGGGGPKRLRLGYAGAIFELHGESAARRYDAGDASSNVQVGFQVPFTLAEPLRDRVGFGLDLTTPGEVIARVRILDALQPQFPFLAERAEALNLALGMGVELPYGLHFGAGLMLLASLRGTVAVGAGGSGAVQSRVDDELVLSEAPVLGVAWQTDALHLGAVYRGELVSEFELQVTIDDLGRIVLPPLDVTGLAQYDPAGLQLEAAIPVDRYTFVLGSSYKRWSGLERTRRQTVTCPSDRSDCEQPAVPSLGLEDTWVPRVAVVARFEPRSHLVARFSLGYFHEPTPLAPASQAANVWDNPRHAFTLGYALELEEPLPRLRVALALQRHLLRERWHHKVEPEFEANGEFAAVVTRGGIWLSLLEVEAAF